MSVLMVFIVLVLAVLWLGGLCWLFVWGIDGWAARGVRVGVGRLLLAIVVFAGPMAFVLGPRTDPYPSTLCVRGHQEWHSNGKSRSKAWICDQWEIR